MMDQWTSCFTEALPFYQDLMTDLHFMLPRFSSALGIVVNLPLSNWSMNWLGDMSTNRMLFLKGNSIIIGLAASSGSFSSAEVWTDVKSPQCVSTQRCNFFVFYFFPDWCTTIWAWHPSQTTSTACTTTGSCSGSGWRGNACHVTLQSDLLTKISYNLTTGISAVFNSFIFWIIP